MSLTTLRIEPFAHHGIQPQEHANRGRTDPRHNARTVLLPCQDCVFNEYAPGAWTVHVSQDNLDHWRCSKCNRVRAWGGDHRFCKVAADHGPRGGAL